jgi:hypothetical protein
VILLLCTSVSFAQRDAINLPDHDEKPYYGGLSFSYINSSFNITQHPKFMQDDTITVVEPLHTGGFGFGIWGFLNLAPHWELRSSLGLSLSFANKQLEYHLTYPNRGLDEEKVMTRTIESTIITFPLQLKFKSDRIHNFRVYTFGGVRWDYDLASNARARKADSFIKLKASDFGVEGGIGFEFYFEYFILAPEIKISHGLNNLHSRDPNLKFSNAIDKMNSRQVFFTIMIHG